MSSAKAAVVLLVAATLMTVAEAATRTDDDKLCEAIGDSPRIAVPPRDLLWFREHCDCYPTLGCAALGTPRMKELREEAAAKVARMKEQEARLKREAAEKRARQEKAAKAEARERERREQPIREALREKYLADCRAYNDCMRDPARKECSAESARRGVMLNETLGEKFALLPDECKTY